MSALHPGDVTARAAGPSWPGTGPPPLARFRALALERQGCRAPLPLQTSAGQGRRGHLLAWAALYRAHFPAQWATEPLRHVLCPVPQLLIRLARRFLHLVEEADLLPLWDTAWLDEDEEASDSDDVRFLHYIPLANPGWYFPLPLEDGEDYGDTPVPVPDALLALLAVLAHGRGAHLESALGVPAEAWDAVKGGFLEGLPVATRELYEHVDAACTAIGGRAAAWEDQHGWSAPFSSRARPHPPRPISVWDALKAGAGGVCRRHAALRDLPLLACYLDRDTGNAFLDVDAESWNEGDADMLEWSPDEVTRLATLWATAKTLGDRIEALTRALARPDVFHATLEAVAETCSLLASGWTEPAGYEGPATAGDEGARAGHTHAPGQKHQKEEGDEAMTQHRTGTCEPVMPDGALPERYAPAPPAALPEGGPRDGHAQAANPGDISPLPAGLTPEMVAEVCRFLHPEFARGTAWDELREPPRFILEGYADQLILKMPRRDGALMAAHRVAVADVARVFSAHRGIEQGPLRPYAPNTLLDMPVGGDRLVLTYVPAGVRTLTLHRALTVTTYTLPLPPFVWAVRIGAHRSEYRIVAVRTYPAAFDEMTYHAPLPNVYDQATICHGSVLFPSPLGPGGIAATLATFFQSNFSGNLLARRSRAHPENLLQTWEDLARPAGGEGDSRAALEAEPEHHQEEQASRRRGRKRSPAHPAEGTPVLDTVTAATQERARGAHTCAAAYPLDDLVGRGQSLRTLLDAMAAQDDTAPW